MLKNFQAIFHHTVSVLSPTYLLFKYTLLYLNKVDTII